MMMKENHFGGTPDPHHKLHEYMDRNGVEWPSRHALVGRLNLFGSISLLFYLFSPFGLAHCYFIIYVKQFDLMGRAQ
jgi:hypothetical protein